jgi:hypothetical protein
MVAVADFFLRAKHWQLFLLFFIIPAFLGIAASVYTPTTFNSWKQLGPGAFICLGLMVLDTLCLLAWLLAIGWFLNSLQKPTVRLNLSFFRVASIYTPIYMLVFFIVILTSEPPMQIIFTLHLFAMFCIFYVFYFVARSLTIVNKGRQVLLGEYAEPLVLLLLYPIGVWRIQPRINQLYAQGTNE